MFRERVRRVILPPAQENIDKLEKVIKEGNYYGAQQMYKSTSARYVSAERYSDALNVLQSGACLQLDKAQITCGAELSLLFAETLAKAKVSYDEDTLDRVRKIYKKFPRLSVPQHLDLADDDDLQKLSEAIAAAKTRVEGCSSFLKAAIKWSAEFGAHRYGSPELHDMLADYMYSESPEVDIGKVSFHFVRGRNPKKFASALVNFMGKCYPGEDDLAIVRAILMYLSLGNLRDANKLMDEVKMEVELKNLNFPSSELTQFVNYLLLTLQRDALPLFNMLRQTYKSSIDRESTFNELLDEIAEKFYGVRRRNPLEGIGDFFKMMGGE
ncbi:protein GET4 isoform X1 [Nicotiana tabacum]|uniref:Protein GET4 isoform X1 n=4 Tax=Nicotiana TaxID=4085 RepID=A0AC58RT51_TOBAC|nr:PREDICTED: Golgi to ER traffic protein 4 homolog isoform X1 [Nicotiana sylvestris]XP_009788294.1 PREDICTED: Golgi to ER traffic protein 4 homolog isoform X1 [Nicotiana sylvestris]